MRFEHTPVLLHELLEYLQPAPGKIYLDGTLGGAGHSSEILKKIAPSGLLIGIDQDLDALAAARDKLAKISGAFEVFHTNYLEFDLILERLQIKQLDGMLLDLGVSSFQLDEKSRGFSYMQDTSLDMRMNQATGLTAEIIVNTWPEARLAKILFEYGEEMWAKRIAQFIALERMKQAIKTTGTLVEIIKSAIPAGARKSGPHPAKRTFQALRIAVNDELGVLEKTLQKAASYLKPRGRIAVIAFHSLEDRIVKKSFQQLAAACICPPDFPECRCGHRKQVRILTKKPVLPSKEEVTENPRARSAKLRVAEKL